MTKREFKPLVRQTNLRDARLIVIATEGTKTEPKYFHDLAHSSKYRNSKVHVEVIKRDESSSSPRAVLRELDKFKSDFNLSETDELWLVFDIDRWGEQVSEVAQECIQKKYHLAISNPCFELWLLLHHSDLQSYNIQDLAQNKR
jgi:hypothetical protein